LAAPRRSRLLLLRRPHLRMVCQTLRLQMAVRLSRTASLESTPASHRRHLYCCPNTGTVRGTDTSSRCGRTTVGCAERASCDTTTTALVSTLFSPTFNALGRTIADRNVLGIGQCVGARNHRFFVLFLLWAMFFCAWIFATLLGLNIARADDPGRGIDAQHIAIIAL
jgi:hypothetical protein